MAETVGLVAGFTSIVTATAGLLQNQSLAASRIYTEEFAEINVLLLVLEECIEVVRKEVKPPIALRSAMDLCVLRHKDLLKALDERISSTSHGLSREVFGPLLKGEPYIPPTDVRRRLWLLKPNAKKLKRHQKEALSSFRRSVLLMRDLTDQLRSQQHLADISATLAGLLADGLSDDVEPVVGSRHADVPHHPALQAANGVLHGRSTSTLDIQPLRRRPTKASVLEDLNRLIRTDFTREIILVLDTGSGGPTERFKYIPAKAKMDTGCTGNLIRRAVLERAFRSESELIQLLLPVAEDVVFDGVNEQKFLPKHRIEITWHQDRGMDSRKDMFYVVDEAPFDLNLGSARLARDLRRTQRSTLILAGRPRTRRERKQDEEAERENLKAEEEVEQKEQEETLRRLQARIDALDAAEAAKEAKNGGLRQYPRD